MELSDLRIDPASLGKNLMLTDIGPVYRYENNKRTEDIIGYRYTVACPRLGLEKVGVKVAGNQRVTKPDDTFPVVEFIGLSLKAYVFNGQAQVTATAEDVKVVKAS